MHLKTVSIGIWGFGVVGKSIANYFIRKNNNITPTQYIQLTILDQRKPTDQEQQFLKKYTINYIKYTSETEIIHFLEQNNIIIPSPGIDLKSYTKYAHKFISELDLFESAKKKINKKTPIISITGSVGKTTITHLLDQIIRSQNTPIWTGGNIGTPVLNITPLLNKKENITFALFELSSFQLEQCKHFAPDLAIWTNLYPNHLDRHENLQNYFNAKLPILTNQRDRQHALIPFSLFNKINKLKNKIKSTLYFFSEKKPTEKDIKNLIASDPRHSLFYLDKDNVKKLCIKNRRKSIQTIGKVSDLGELATFTFSENILIILSSLYIINKRLKLSATLLRESPRNKTSFNKINNYNIAHRLEKVTTVNGVTFYNDSKSTTPASTLAAVKKLSGSPILLLLGGLSKGVDRSTLIENIKNHVKQVITFGQEAQNLKNMCQKENIPCISFDTLDPATKHCFANAKNNDIVLFSPAGSSFDLFENYIARGESFKDTVLQIEKNYRKTP